jgi:hypothetical protein
MTATKITDKVVRVVDMDGTVSDDSWRKCLIRYDTDSLTEKYKAYHAAAKDDKPMNTNLLLDLPEAITGVAIVTSRPAAHFDALVDWLGRHALERHVTDIMMRADDDHRPSWRVKLDLLQAFVAKGNVRVVEAFDDSAEVCAAYQRQKDLGPMLVWEVKGTVFAPPADAVLQENQKPDFVAKFALDVVAARLDGLARYGQNDNWNALGSKGVFVDLSRKYNRIKSVVWDQSAPPAETTSETCADTLLDMAVYCAFMAESIRRATGKLVEAPKKLSGYTAAAKHELSKVQA